VEPLPPSGRATRAPVPMGLQEKPTDVEGPRGRHSAGPAAQAPAPPSQSPLPRGGWSGAECDEGKSDRERRVHPPAPRTQTHRSLGLGGTGTPGPPSPPTNATFSGLFHCARPGEPQIINRRPHRTAPHRPLTPLTARHRPHPSLETRALAARHRPHWSPRPVPRVTYATFP
jgi:hypothetical protein